MQLLLAALIGSVLAQPAPPQNGSVVVTLLGTGTPNPRIERLGPGTLVEAGDKRLLFDAGRGATIRLEQAGVRAGSISALFFTHLHSDHVVGLPDLWLTGWLPSFGGRSTALRVIGPVGTRGLVAGLESAFAADLRMRTKEERLPASGVAFQATEFHREMTVFDEGGVRVTSFEVDHGGELKPAYGYRVSYGGRTVVISGDTRYSENLIRHAEGADVIIHEVAMAPKEIANQKSVQFILAHHTSPEEVARVFTKVKPRLAVLTHFATPPNRQGSSSTADDIVTEAAQHYEGRMVAGEDLMRIVVGDTIEVQRAGRQGSEAEFAAFLDRVDKAQLEFQQGRPDAYKSLWSHEADVTLGGGFGGNFERGWNDVAKRLDWASSQFQQGRNEIQRIAFSTSGDLGYLVQMEHLDFTTPASSAPVERLYRVTMLFRRENGQWRIIHRHADTQTARQTPR